MSTTRARSGFGAVHLVRRQLTSATGALALIGITVLLVTTLLTAWPRAVDLLLAEDLAAGLDSLSDARLEPSATTTGWWPQGVLEGGTGAEALAIEEAWLLEQRDREAGPALRPALSGVTVVAHSERIPVETGTRSDHLAGITLRTRLDAHLAERIAVVEGNPPGALDLAALEDAMETAIEGNLRSLADTAPALEVVASVETADRMGWAVGETRPLAGPFPWRITLVGTFEAVDPSDGHWGHLESTLFPWIDGDFNTGTQVHGTAYADPSAARVLMMVSAMSLQYWFEVERRPVAEAPTAQLAAELRGFEATTGTRSELAATLAATLGQQRTLTTLLTVLAVGPVGAALGVLWLACRLAVDRRRAALELARARGASRGGLALAVAVQGAVVALPAAVLGAWLATLAVPGPVRPAAYLLPAAVGAAPAALMALAATGAGTAPEQATSTPVAQRRRRRRRVAAEVAVVVLAALAVVAVRQRGLTGEAVGTDPVLLALPVLLTLAVAVVVLRLYPWPMRALVRTLHRRRGLTPALGASVATRSPASTASVVALVLAVAVTVFSGVTFSTVRAGITDTAVRTAGADLRLDLSQGSFEADDVAALATLDGVGAAVAVHGAGEASVDVGRTDRTVDVTVVDAAVLADVHEGVDLTRLPLLPESLATATGDALPVVLSTALADVGGPMTLTVDGQDVPLDPVGHADAVPGVAGGTWWVVVDRAQLERAVGDTMPALTTGRVLVDLTGADLTDVRAAAAARHDDVTSTTPASVAAGLRSAPLVTGMETGLGVVTAASALLAVGVIVLTLALGAPGRDRRAALLATLGAPRRGVRGLLLWEVVPLAVVAGIAGGAVGLALPVVLLPMAELRPFTGGVLPPALTADPILAAVVALAGVLAVALATAIAGRRAGRTDPVRVLREGDRS